MAWFPPDGGEPLKFLRSGHSPDLLRRLRRGYWPVEDELDLHGLNRVQAARAISGFLDQAAGMRCVLIVHGRGLGVLRETLRATLPERAEVLAFVEAPPAQGGAGAALVLLKS
ncbi:MAG TPA: Smr/MutS family protein [Burkholderiales bacterium]|nr:Smr/MutS family protein [Burkholderiales bacterium]